MHTVTHLHVCVYIYIYIYISIYIYVASRRFPDDKGVNTRIQQLEEELRNLRRTQGIDEDGNIIGVI